MRTTPLAPKLAIARAVGALSRRGGRGGTSLPGKVLMRLDAGAVAQLAGRLPRGSAVISATNGKTTTAAMVSRILGENGVTLVHNRAGANMGGGIASALLAAAGPRHGIAGQLGLFEVDEFWLEQMVTELRPRHLLLGNLFRDQLDRYGELEIIADRWAQLLRSDAARRTRLVLNADDPVIADLGRRTSDGAPGEGALYFGVQDDAVAMAALSHAADAKHCRRCGAPYVFDAIYLGHLGRYHCPSCGQTRPTPIVSATEISLEGVRAAQFTLVTPQGRARVRLPLPGLYNVYNAVGAAALAHALEVPLSTTVRGLEAVQAAFGRAEQLSLDGRELRILLVKNPAGANEVLRTLALEPGTHDLLGVLNDRIADGRDVSWVWDSDFELIADRVRHVTCAGTRAAELALRLKYAGVDPERIVVREDLAAALQSALDDRPPQGGPLYALPTYTAMLALRELLVRRGQAPSSWA